MRIPVVCSFMYVHLINRHTQRDDRCVCVCAHEIVVLYIGIAFMNALALYIREYIAHRKQLLHIKPLKTTTRQILNSIVYVLCAFNHIYLLFPCSRRCHAVNAKFIRCKWTKCIANQMRHWRIISVDMALFCFAFFIWLFSIGPSDDRCDRWVCVCVHQNKLIKQEWHTEHTTGPGPIDRHLVDVFRAREREQIIQIKYISIGTWAELYKTHDYYIGS